MADNRDSQIIIGMDYYLKWKKRFSQSMRSQGRTRSTTYSVSVGERFLNPSNLIYGIVHRIFLVFSENN